MNKRFTKVGLGLAVIVIWGVVFYRIYQALSPTDDFVMPSVIHIPTNNPSAMPDTFVLIANYRDPFLGKLPNNKRDKRRKPSSKTDSGTFLPQTSKPKEKVIFPKIIFKGFVENRKVKTVLLSIEGKNHYLRPGQMLDGLSVMQVHKDSVVLQLKGVKRTFSRN